LERELLAAGSSYLNALLSLRRNRSATNTPESSPRNSPTSLPNNGPSHSPASQARAAGFSPFARGPSSSSGPSESDASKKSYSKSPPTGFHGYDHFRKTGRAAAGEEESSTSPREEEEAEAARMASMVGERLTAHQKKQAAQDHGAAGRTGESAQERVRREATEAYARMKQLPDDDDEEEEEEVVVGRRNPLPPPTTTASEGAASRSISYGLSPSVSVTVADDDLMAEELAYQGKVERVHQARMRQQAYEARGDAPPESQSGLQEFLQRSTVREQAEEEAASRQAHQQKIAAKTASLEGRLKGTQRASRQQEEEERRAFVAGEGGLGEALSRDGENRIVFSRAFPASLEDSLDRSFIGARGDTAEGARFGEADLSVLSIEQRLAEVRARRASRDA